MPAGRPRSQTPQTQQERRRSERVLLVVPVDVAWVKQGGARVQESAETEEVNAHGALLRMSAPLPLKTLVVLTHRITNKSTPAQVVRTCPGQEDGKPRIAVELEEPSETFWGVSIPPIRS